MKKSNLYVILFRFATMSKYNFQICGKKSHTNAILLQSQKWSELPLTTIVYTYTYNYYGRYNVLVYCLCWMDVLVKSVSYCDGLVILS